jgi:excisionase family DNA binding protein
MREEQVMGRRGSGTRQSEQREEPRPLVLSERLWTVTEVSTYLGVPVGTLYQWRTRGQGPVGLRVGRHLRYRPVDVARWLDEGRSESA